MTLLLVLAGPISSAGAVDVRAECYQGCIPAGLDQTPDLILREDSRGEVMLRWTLDASPAHATAAIRLYAGNPVREERLIDRGELRFEEKNGRRVAFFRFSGAELGEGSFLTVLVRENGSSERIFDWRAWRLSTAAALRRERTGPPASSLELTLQPTVLRADTPRGPLPRGRGGDPAVWWSLAGGTDSLQDLDLDGAATGAPGLGIDISSPWFVTAGEDPRQALMPALEGPDGHRVRLSGLDWLDRGETLAPLYERAGEARVTLRQYYSVVTLHSAASVKTLHPGERSASASGDLISHETSARLEQPSDARLWASYSEREYGRDLRLLELVRKQIEADGGVPGLQGVMRGDGDGGPATFHVGFVARARPWEDPGAKRGAQAVIVGLDVVAARVGHGMVLAGKHAVSPLQKALAGLLERGNALEPGPPPPGYFTYPVSAELTDPPGGVPLRVAPAAQRTRGGRLEP